MNKSFIEYELKAINSKFLNIQNLLKMIQDDIKSINVFSERIKEELGK